MPIKKNIGEQLKFFGKEFDSDRCLNRLYWSEPKCVHTSLTDKNKIQLN